MKPTVVNPEYQSHVEFLELTSDWLRQHKDQLDWTSVCRYQKLDQSFIQQMDQYVNWIAVSKWQIYLSQDFIRRHWDKLKLGILKERGIKIPEDLYENINVRAKILYESLRM